MGVTLTPRQLSTLVLHFLAGIDNYEYDRFLQWDSLSSPPAPSPSNTKPEGPEKYFSESWVSH